jgi:hypothetical protein
VRKQHCIPCCICINTVLYETQFQHRL